jgi:phosphopantetheinyl transferase (holo-ACP synthase)
MSPAEVTVKARYKSDAFFARVLGTKHAASSTSGGHYAAKRCAAKALGIDEQEVTLRTIKECRWNQPGEYKARKRTLS